MMPGRRILVVEDNPLNLKLVRDVLTAFEYDVVEAHSGEEGVELAGTCSPDLVLMVPSFSASMRPERSGAVRCSRESTWCTASLDG